MRNGFIISFQHEGRERASARGRRGEEPGGGEGAEDEDRDQEGGAEKGDKATFDAYWSQWPVLLQGDHSGG